MALAARAYSVAAPVMCEQRSESALLAEVLAGLSAVPRRVASVWLHDERGAALYDRLCAAAEYYLARAELALVDEHASEIAARVGPDAALIEFGSGTSLKARVLLDELQSPAAYVPVDVARTPLIAAARTMAARFPDVTVLPVCADFTRAFVLPPAVQNIDRRVVYLSGATLGNYTPGEAAELLRLMHVLVGPDGAVLVGLDLAKDDPRVAERAYNDRGGVMAELNRNALRHLNHRFGANFDLRQFVHRAVWVDEQSRVEMGLVSTCDQAVDIGGQSIAFTRDHELVTEYGHKYSPERFEALAGDAGLETREGWSDDRWQFSVQWLEPANEQVRRQPPIPEGKLLLPGRLGSAPAF